LILTERGQLDMWVLGLNAPPLGWHDPAACLVDERGAVWALVEEERITRQKHGLRSHPRQAAATCLQIAGIGPADIDVVAIGWDLPRHSARADLGQLNPPVLGRPWQFGDSRDLLGTALGWHLDPVRHPEVVFVPHHLAHACASFYASGYAEAAVLVLDGDGDDESISIYEASAGRPLIRRERWPIPSSLGFMYAAASEFIGLSFLEAGKTMGLAAYGRAWGLEASPIFDISPDSFSTPFALPANAAPGRVVDAWRGHFVDLGYEALPRDPFDLDRDHAAVRLAWSAQASLETVLATLAERARRVTRHRNLCLSGGVALNCSANGLLPGPVYVPPVPHDAGVSLGAAWSVVPPARDGRTMTPYLGRRLSPPAVDAALSRHGLEARPTCPDWLADQLLRGKIAAVVTGRAEVGPRALCHRSIVAFPGDEAIRDRINQAKGRELWRPLGPVGLPACEGEYWSENRSLHQYMVGAATVTETGRRSIPAVVHVDGTARPQVLAGDGDGVIKETLERLARLHEPPVLINTSFNRRGEPLVDDADGALASAIAMTLDLLVLEDRTVVLS
jgi:carbamoyltransferase